MSKKCDVKWFVSSCRTKALTTIVKKAEEEFVNSAIESGTINEFVNKTEETKERLNDLQAYLMGNTDIKPYTSADVAELLTKSYWEYGLPNGSTLKQSVFSEFYGLINDRLTKYFAKYIIESNADKGLYDLLLKYTAEFEAVRAEYQKLQKEIDLMSPVQSVKFLETLGFDVSKLRERTQIKEEPDKFDKSLIFVCGDNK